MAKQALLQRELKREKLAAKFAKKYAELKATSNDFKRTDDERALARLDKEALPAAERAVAPVRVELEQAHAAMEAICERNAYRYVSLLEMCAVKTAAV